MYFGHYRDQAGGWKHEELLFNSCHGLKYISSPKCTYWPWASPNLLCSGYPWLFQRLWLTFTYSSPATSAEDENVWNSPSTPSHMLLWHSQDSFSFLLPLRSTKFESGRGHYLC